MKKKYTIIHYYINQSMKEFQIKMVAIKNKAKQWLASGRQDAVLVWVAREGLCEGVSKPGKGRF